MQEIDRRISDFICKHHVMTLATCVQRVWCANLFYAYIKSENVFIFTSDDKTFHAEQMGLNNRVAASIVLETRIVGKVRGLQIEGLVRKAVENEDTVRKAYLKRFPYAALSQLSLWLLEPETMKYTDNTLGFGKKLLWNRAEISEP